MDFFGPRGLLLVVGVLVVLALVLDGLRRIKRNRYENLHMSSRKLQKSASNNSDDSDPYLDSQFPSGGSRVVGVRDQGSLEEVESLLRGTDGFSGSAPARQEQLDLEATPMEQGRAELQKAELEKAQLDMGQAQQLASKAKASAPQEVLVMHLMANKGETIDGQQLLDGVLAAGFRFGGRKIFDRHIGDQGSGEILFSLANVANPGTFDLNTIAQLQTPGVTLFMDLEQLTDPVAAFDTMIKSVDSLVAQLHLNVQDESRSSMTKQTIDHYRQRARAVSHKRDKGN
ncbi:MAG: cell division protein ZipA [Porticoccaceae bacterium]|nr:cell division protein ZipA [Porticoccaceae bacterium]